MTMLWPAGFGLEPNVEAIGIDGRRRKLKDGCVRPFSSAPKAFSKDIFLRAAGKDSIGS